MSKDKQVKVKTYKDNQIIYENWMQTLTRRAEAGLRTLTIRKPVVKHIPVEIWSEIDSSDTIKKITELYKYRDGYGRQIHNEGGRTYLVSTQKQGDK